MIGFVAAVAFASCSKNDFVTTTQADIDKAKYDQAFMNYIGGRPASNQDWGFGSSASAPAFTRSITVNADTYSEFNFPSDAELAAAFPTSIPGDADEVSDLPTKYQDVGDIYAIYVNKIVEGYNLKVTNEGNYKDNVVELGGNYQNVSWDQEANKQVVHPYNVYVNVDGNVTIKRIGATHFNLYILKGNVTFLSNYGEQAGIISVAAGATLNDGRDRTAANQGIKVYNRGTINATNANGYDIGNNSTVYNEGKFDITGAMSYSPGAGNTSYFINFGDDAELTAASMTLNSTCHFYTGGTVNISGETKVTQQGIVWINNGHYTTNTMVFSAHNGTFYNYCHLICNQDCAFKDGQFNMMSGSYAEFGYGVFNNFHVVMKNNSGIFIKNGTCFGQQGAGIQQGFFAEDGATAYVRLGGETKIPAHKGSAFQLYGAGLTLAYENITWWEGFHLADTYSASSYWTPTSQAQLEANKDERTTWLLNNVTNIVTGDDFSKVSATRNGCSATWKVPSKNPTCDLRIIAEDLSATQASDFDFNDVVLDVTFAKNGNPAKVMLVAAGGTLELKVGSTNGADGVEVHDALLGAENAKKGSLYKMVSPGGDVWPVDAVDITNYLSDKNITNAADANTKIRIEVNKNGEWQLLTAPKGEPACKLAVDDTFQILRERASIKGKYTLFVDWATTNAPNLSEWWKLYPTE